MPPSVEDRLRDILEAIAEIEGMLGGMEFEGFAADRIRGLATERCLEVVCEATRRLSDDIKRDTPHIEWQKIIDFGNFLRHAYHETNPKKVWDIIQNHLPPLKSFVEERIRLLE